MKAVLLSARQLTPAQCEDLSALAARLDITEDEAARRLFLAALDALKDETDFVWPIFLVQTTPTLNGDGDLF